MEHKEERVFDNVKKIVDTVRRDLKTSKTVVIDGVPEIADEYLGGRGCKAPLRNNAQWSTMCVYYPRTQ